MRAADRPGPGSGSGDVGRRDRGMGPAGGRLVGHPRRGGRARRRGSGRRVRRRRGHAAAAGPRLGGRPRAPRTSGGHRTCPDGDGRAAGRCSPGAGRVSGAGPAQRSSPAVGRSRCGREVPPGLVAARGRLTSSVGGALGRDGSGGGRLVVLLHRLRPQGRDGRRQPDREAGRMGRARRGGTPRRSGPRVSRSHAHGPGHSRLGGR